MKKKNWCDIELTTGQLIIILLGGTMFGVLWISGALWEYGLTYNPHGIII